MGYETLAEAVDGLARRGFAEGFRVAEGGLRALGTGERVRARDLVIRGFYRFEGISDPDDMAIVYAVESRSGLRGTLVDAFGTYADPALGAVLSAIPAEPDVNTGACSRHTTCSVSHADRPQSRV